jgi:2'-5' RNA ligase
MADPHVTISLTFRTPAAGAVVLEHVLAAVNRSAMPYELTNTGCCSFDLDEVED